jgi:hypothetical protein
MNLGALIESAADKIKEDKEKEAILDIENATEDEILEASLWPDDGQNLITTEDYEEYNEFQDDLVAADEEYLKSIVGENMVEEDKEKDKKNGSK